MRFSCPHCGKALNIKDKLAGKRAKCPGCKNVLRIPAVAAVPAAGPSASAGSKCPNCDQPLPPGAVLCVKCGYDTRTRRILRTEFGGD